MSDSMITIDSSSSDRPVLTYFDGPGRAELSRLCFKAGRIDFEDVRLTGQEWSEVKFDTTKPAAQLFNTMPFIQHSAQIIGQSAAVSMYAAGLGINKDLNATQQALEVMYLMCHKDLQALLYAFMHSPDSAFEELKKKAPATLAAIERQIPDNTVDEEQTKFIQGGEKPTMADLCIFDAVAGYPGLHRVNFDMSPYPKINAHVKRVLAVPEIAEYVKTKSYFRFI